MESEKYTTSDLGVATALVCSGYELLSMDKTNIKRVLFVFNYENDIEKSVNKYWIDKLKVSARSYFDNMKMLKNRIYSD